MPGLDDRASVIGPGARLGDKAQCHVMGPGDRA